MEDVSNKYLQLSVESSESTPLFSNDLDFFPIIDDGESSVYTVEEKDREVAAFSDLYEGIDQLMTNSQEFVYYSSIWNGKVLKVLKDTVLARLTTSNDDSKEYFVEIERKRISQAHEEDLHPGALFSLSFGFKGAESNERIWKLIFQQQPKLSQEAILERVAKMIKGFEDYYLGQD